MTTNEQSPWPHAMVIILVLAASALAALKVITGSEWITFCGSLAVGWLIPSPNQSGSNARAPLGLAALCFALLSACSAQYEFHGNGERTPAAVQSRLLGFTQTPLTSWPASAPVELGGAQVGSFYASADRIDVTVVMTSGAATFKLIYYNPGTSRWEPVDTAGWTVDSADTVNSPNKTRTARVIARKQGLYYQVYKASGAGTIAACSLEIAFNGSSVTSLGSLEPAASVPPSGAAGGSLAGTYPNPTIAASGVSAASYPTSGQIPTFTVGTDGRLTAAGSTTALTAPVISGAITGTPTLGVNLAAGGFKVTGLGAPASSGDALAYPWLGSVNGSASLSTSAFTLNAATGVFQDVGLSVTLPSAGTYLITATVRSSVNASAGVGAFVIGKLYNNTDAADITNSERILAQNATLTVLNQITSIISEVVTVAASKTIKVYCAKVFSGTATGEIGSDTNGRSRISYVKINDT